MREPLRFENSLRTPSGYLPTSIIQETRRILLKGGFALLPSDTCYSLGALAIDENSRFKVNTVLRRVNEPISLAFNTYLSLQVFVKMNNVIAALIERFTPGPFTIVCEASDAIADAFLKHTLGSLDGTIGIRIPDSRDERDLAGSTLYPLMTVAVRDKGKEIRDFEQAIDVVKRGIETLDEKFTWAAIPLRDDGFFYPLHSTVVRVSKMGEVKLLREGFILFSSVEEEILLAEMDKR